MIFPRKNVTVNLHATGLAAAVIAWVGAVAAVAILADSQLGAVALGLLSGGIALIAFLGGRA